MANRSAPTEGQIDNCCPDPLRLDIAISFCTHYSSWTEGVLIFPLYETKDMFEVRLVQLS